MLILKINQILLKMFFNIEKNKQHITNKPAKFQKYQNYQSLFEIIEIIFFSAFLASFETFYTSIIM